jgi:hypothetical protein
VRSRPASKIGAFFGRCWSHWLDHTQTNWLGRN